MEIKIKTLSLAIACFLAGTATYARHALRDSIGVENLNGKRVILHRVESGETYYGVSRRYHVDAKSLIAFNKNAALRPGLVIKVATEKPYTAQALVRSNTEDRISNTPITNNTTQHTAFIEYKVGSKETLFALSKRFDVSVDAIKQANNLSGDGINMGQILKIPNQQTSVSKTNVAIITDDDIRNDQADPRTSVAVVAEEVVAVSEKIEVEEKKNTEPTDKYGLKQVTASGIGVWMDDIGGGENGKMLALHNTAPVGTVVQISNPMNNRTTYAKVVGKFNETAQNKDAIIVISKSVAGLIGVIDRRFQVKLSY